MTIQNNNEVETRAQQYEALSPLMKQIEQTHPETNQGANPSHAVLVAECVRLREQVRVLREAARDFVNKVQSGKAQSRDSYAKFMAALEATKS